MKVSSLPRSAAAKTNKTGKNLRKLLVVSPASAFPIDVIRLSLPTRPHHAGSARQVAPKAKPTQPLPIRHRSGWPVNVSARSRHSPLHKISGRPGLTLKVGTLVTCMTVNTSVMQSTHHPSSAPLHLPWPTHPPSSSSALHRLTHSPLGWLRCHKLAAVLRLKQHLLGRWPPSRPRSFSRFSRLAQYPRIL